MKSLSIVLAIMLCIILGLIFIIFSIKPDESNESDEPSDVRQLRSILSRDRGDLNHKVITLCNYQYTNTHKQSVNCSIDRVTTIFPEEYPANSFFDGGDTVFYGSITLSDNRVFNNIIIGRCNSNNKCIYFGSNKQTYII